MARRSQPYPWNAWLDGEPRTFLLGRDFDCEPEHFRKQLQAAIRVYRDRRPALADLATKVDGTSVRLTHTRRRVEAHDWPTLLNGEIHKQVKGADFYGDHEEFIRQARRAARKQGVKVRTKTRGTAYYREVYLQALPKDSA